MEIKINSEELEKAANELKNIYLEIEKSIVKLKKMSKNIEESNFKTIENTNPNVISNIELIKQKNNNNDLLTSIIKEIGIAFDDLETNAKNSFVVNLGENNANKN